MNFSCVRVCFSGMEKMDSFLVGEKEKGEIGWHFVEMYKRRIFPVFRSFWSIWRTFLARVLLLK